MPHKPTPKQAIVTAVVTLVAGAAMVAAVMGSEHRDAPPFFGRSSAASQQGLDAPGDRIRDAIQSAREAVNNLVGSLPTVADIVDMIPTPEEAVDAALDAAETAREDAQVAIDGAQEDLDEATEQAQEDLDDQLDGLHTAVDGAVSDTKEKAEDGIEDAKESAAGALGDVHEAVEGLEPTLERTQAFVSDARSMVIGESGEMVAYLGRARDYATDTARGEAVYLRDTAQGLGQSAGGYVQDLRGWTTSTLQSESDYLNGTVDGARPSWA